MSKLEPVRALLPWIMMPRYRNVISSIRPDGEIEVYRSAVIATYIYVPGAASLLAPRYAHANFYVEKVDNKDGTKKYQVTLSDVDAYVVGYLPDGRKVVFRRRLSEEMEGLRIEIEGRITQDDIDMLTSLVGRLKAGKYFGGIVANFAKTHNIMITRHSRYSLNVIEVQALRAKAEVRIKTRVYNVSFKDKTILAPGVVPAVANIISYPERFRGGLASEIEGYDKAKELVDRIRDMGGRFADMALLYSISKARFRYIVGELYNTPRNDRLLISDKIAKGTRASFIATEKGKVLLEISFLPLSPPAMFVASFPPLNISPLAATVNERFLKLKVLANKAKKYMERGGLAGEIYIDELEPLRDAKLSIEDVRGMLKDGYPLPSRINRILDELDKLSDIADILQVTSGGGLERLLVKALKPDEEKKAKTTKEIKLFEDVKL